ncbi:hypothetical protein PAMA_018779 [Pampus argenteus]
MCAQHRPTLKHILLSETPKTHCEEHARHRHPGAAKVNSELHLYLPSSLCEDEEQDAETEEMRPSAEEPRSRDSESLHMDRTEKKREASGDKARSCPQEEDGGPIHE